MSKPSTASEVLNMATNVRDCAWPAVVKEYMVLIEPMLRELAEHIKADEGAVPVATLHADGFWTWKGTPPHESNHAGWRMDVFAHPPAQAAHDEDVVLAAIAANPDDAVDQFDEPVAQGEVAAEVYAGAFGTHYIACADPNKLPVGTKLYAAQPRAVPAERVVEGWAAFICLVSWLRANANAAVGDERKAFIEAHNAAKVIERVHIAAAPSPGESK